MRLPPPFELNTFGNSRPIGREIYMSGLAYPLLYLEDTGIPPHRYSAFLKITLTQAAKSNIYIFQLIYIILFNYCTKGRQMKKLLVFGFVLFLCVVVSQPVIADYKNEIKEIIKDSDNSVTGVNVVQQVDETLTILVFIEQKSIWSEASFFLMACRPVQTVCKDVKKYKSHQPIKEIVFFLRGPTNYGMKLFMKMHVPIGQLTINQVDPNQVPYQDFLNYVSDLEQKPVGRSVVNSYCRSKDGLLSQNFCLSFMH